ncbi:MAG TPA: hypothetical protein DCF77_19395, partial [Pseudomonas sp.]|nr:hypothetical protein [Pseudomonas sp.]
MGTAAPLPSLRRRACVHVALNNAAWSRPPAGGYEERHPPYDWSGYGSVTKREGQAADLHRRPGG